MVVRYTSSDEDSARWDGFPFRDGDIVVSTRSKHGTTWVQYLCLLLVRGGPDLPQPLAELSPWLDRLGTPREEVIARLEGQPHRRVIKTHTPLDGVPLDPRATYVVVARHPLDAAVSLYHQSFHNLDRARMRELAGASPSQDRSPEARPRPDAPALRDWLAGWIADDTAPADGLDGLGGVFHHVGDAWQRRGQPNVVLVHYADLQADLDGALRRLADRLAIGVPDRAWPSLVEAATFPAMRARAADLVPDRSGVIRDPRQFFREGRSGAGRAALGPVDLDRYLQRAATLAPPDLLAWLHRP